MALYLQVIQTAGHFGQSLLKSNVDLQIYSGIFKVETSGIFHRFSPNF